MIERDDDPREEPAEPAVDGGTGPGVTPGDAETPGAATTANEPERDAGEDGD